MLPVSYAGVALIVLGSVMLIDADTPGWGLPLGLVVSVVAEIEGEAYWDGGYVGNPSLGVRPCSPTWGAVPRWTWAPT